ncbi:MAG: histidine phosphatase family protein [Proteobacteria bacterium]|nr:histidine phosphatase family protein [Pseudomonadota bacterium]
MHFLYNTLSLSLKAVTTIKGRNTLPLTPFYFIRHSETDWNNRNIIMGSNDIPLNELGLRQAHEASQLLKKESFDVIISNTKLRARQTADIIAKATKKPILFEEGLTERIWGEAEGQPVDSTKSLFDDEHTPQGAETFSAFQQRILETTFFITFVRQTWAWRKNM